MMDHIECGNPATGIKINHLDGVKVYDRRQFNSLSEWDRRVAMIHAKHMLGEIECFARVVDFVREHGWSHQSQLAEAALTDEKLGRGILVASYWNQEWSEDEQKKFRCELLIYLLTAKARGTWLKPGTLYLVRNDTGLYHFGGSTDFATRLHRLNSTTPGGTTVVWKSNVLNCLSKVADAQRHLVGYRVCGRWYKLGAEQVEWFVAHAREGEAEAASQPHAA